MLSPAPVNALSGVVWSLLGFLSLPSLVGAGTLVPPPALQPPALIEIDQVALAPEFFVAPEGSDDGPGTFDRPFATLTRARDAVRELKRTRGLPRGGVAVTLRGGTYRLLGSFDLTAEDSGSTGSPIVYRAWRDETPRLHGARLLAAADFRPVTESPVAARLDPTARGHVVALDLAAHGITSAGPFPQVFSDHGGLFELFVNGERMPLSRWPNAGASTMAKALVNGDAKTPGVFEYRDDRPARWPAEGGFWLKGNWRVGWEDPAILVASIDSARKQITFAAGIHQGIGNKYTRPHGNGKEPWWALNLVEEIDRPGEWAVDFESKTLYFWPPADLATAQIAITQSTGPLIRTDRAAHVAFLGLTLEYSLGDGVLVQGGNDVLLAGCTLRYLAGTGATLHGTHHGVQSCDMYALGRGCIFMSGGDRLTLTPARSYAVNNHLRHYGVLKSQYAAAIDFASNDPARTKRVDAVGLYAAHNLIHHGPRDAFVFSGNDHLFELNEVHNCGYGTADVGAFYTWLDWTIRGVLIRHNFLHNTVGGVNPDDGASGHYVFGNILVGQRVGFWVASGPDHSFVNNVIVKDEGPVFGIDDRGASRGYATNATLIARVKQISPETPPWSTRYPEMVDMLARRPELPWRTVFARNVVVMQRGDLLANKLSSASRSLDGILHVAENFVTATDPGFVNAAARHYGLRPDAEVFRQIPGFQPIPFERIGLKLDTYRRRLPTDAEAGRHDTDATRRERERNFGT
jgi:hypothetical protein